ncbi:hypothetical protein [Haloferula sp. BvORR071]|uniref:hypothetical protein n=1 Tax=Haloferula sp. BvORR071 TaxID=1396141 RepID=UPI00054FFEC6|nr:hypothetical protein [Haloferula sp. BvORR071]
MKPSAKFVAGLAAVLALAISALLTLRPAKREDREPSPAPIRASAREPAASATTAGTDHHRTDAKLSAAERQAALDLIERMRGPAQKFPVTRMADEGEAFPRELLDELAAMNASQFQIVLLAMGKDQTIHFGSRTTIAVHGIIAWMKEQKHAGRQELEVVLGCIEELLPEFPRGHSTLLVMNTINSGARWDCETMGDFILKHSDLCGGPDSRDFDLLRQSMLRYASGPELALAQIKQLGMPADLQEAGRQIAYCGSASGAEPQTVMAAFQQIHAEYGDGPQTAGLRAGIVAGLGERLTAWSPAQVDPWLQASDLSDAERGILLERISLPRNPQTALDWIHWIEPRLPSDKTAQQITALGNQWAFEDQAAAERWISALPEGQTRTLAVQGFLQVARDPAARERVGALAAE